jgi:DNA-binding Lrp family transcriptional regulator
LGKIRKINGCEGVDIVTGTTDIVAKVRVENMHILNDLIIHKIRMIEGIDKTLMVLEEVR